jgi:hypothetical protein
MDSTSVREDLLRANGRHLAKVSIHGERTKERLWFLSGASLPGQGDGDRNFD